MKYAGIAGLLAVVTAVTGAAIPKVDLSQATESEVAQLQKELSDVQNALDAALEKDNQKRGVVGALASGIPVAGPVVAGVAGPLKRGVVTDATGQVPGHQVVDTAVDTAKGVTNNVPVAGQVVDQVLKRGVVTDATGQVPGHQVVDTAVDTAKGVTNNVPVAGQVVDQVLKRDVVGDLTNEIPVVGKVLERGAVGSTVGSLTDSLEGPVKNVPVVGQVLPTVTGALKSVTNALPLKRDGPVGGLTQSLEEPLNSVPAVGPVVGSALNSVGGAVDGLAGKVTGSMGKRDGPVGGLTQTLEEPLNSVPAVGPVVGGAVNTLGETVDGIAGKVTGSMAKRDDPVSQLAGNLLPQLNNLGVLPEGFGVQQLTGLLQTLNAKGLVGNVEQLLGGLLNGGLLKTVSGLLPVKRDDAISQLAGSLLPELLQNNVLSNVGVDQLTTLLQTLNVNGLLQNVGGGLL